MSEKLQHSQIEELMMGLADAKLINLDVPVRTVMQSVSSVLKKSPGGPSTELHIVCCNEYGLVTR